MEEVCAHMEKNNRRNRRKIRRNAVVVIEVFLRCETVYLHN